MRKKLAGEVNNNESIPCIVYGRLQRANPTVETPEQYWRVTISQKIKWRIMNSST